MTTEQNNITIEQLLKEVKQEYKHIHSLEQLYSLFYPKLKKEVKHKNLTLTI